MQRFHLYSRNLMSLPENDFPEEVKSIVFKSLTGRDLQQLYKTNDTTALNKDDIWASLYKRDFGSLPHPENVKFQYAAACLYRHAGKISRPDIAQMYFRILREFISFLPENKKNTWAQYYIGVMSYYGQGICRTASWHETALRESCFTHGDYLAAIAIVSAMRNESMTNLICLPANVDRKNLYNILIQAWNNGHAKAALPLAYLCRYGIDVKPDTAAAKIWLERAMQAGEVAAATELMDLLSASRQPFLWEVMEIYAQEYNHSPSVQAEIYYQLGGKYYKKPSERLSNMEKAADLGHAEACFYLTTGRNNVNTNGFLCRAFHSRHHTATLMYFANKYNLISAIYDKEQQREALLTLLTQFKQAAVQGNTGAIKALAMFYNQDLFGTGTGNLVIIDDEAKKTWWLQLSLQAYEDSFWENTYLSHLCSKHESAFAAVALGIIYTFGILGSSVITADPHTAANYFADAEERCPGVIENYMLAGAGEGLLTSELRDFLQAKSQMYKSRNTHPEEEQTGRMSPH